jgi:hypothetical protein
MHAGVWQRHLNRAVARDGSSINTPALMQSQLTVTPSRSSVYMHAGVNKDTTTEQWIARDGSCIDYRSIDEKPAYNHPTKVCCAFARLLHAGV